MNPILKFVNRMDASAWRSVIVTLLLLVSVISILLMGRLMLFTGEEDGLMADVQTYLQSLRSSPFGLLAVIVVFCILAFLGAPQFGLMGAAVLAFGPWLGFLYAWIGTIVSASLTFWCGRWFGISLVKRYGGESIQRLSRFMGRNDFLASAVVRNVPTAPFIVVNMAFGASEARFLHYAAGVAVGIIPKTLLMALFGQAVAQSLAGNPLFAFGALAAMVVLWIALMLFARTRIKNNEKPVPAEQGEETGENHL
ncbi:TVP38/TMEM64 family protein [Ponticaulis profundi]|uniref:TVP38/TMEM64 family membrane protein n=1 Tax=Ponticaulis profundi TaxID=2665222 RepID=A0ABW1S600_9PROT